MERISHVTILGAGVCGLATALKLQKAGIQTLLLESKPHVGGLAKTITWQGFQFEVGPRHFFTSEKLIYDEFGELSNGTFQIPIRKNRIWLQNRWISFPLGVHSLLQTSPPFLIKAFIEYSMYRLRHSLPTFMKDPCKSSQKKMSAKPHFGPSLDQLFLFDEEDYLWAGTTFDERQSWSSSFETNERVHLQNPKFQLSQKYASHQTTFHDPEKGVGCLAETMKKKIESLGGKIETNARIHRVFVPRGEVQAVHYHCQGEHWSLTDYVFSTIPLSSLLSLLEPLPAHSLVEMAFHLKYKTRVYLMVAFEGDRYASHQDFYFPEKAVPFFRAHFMRHAVPEMTPWKIGLNIECLLNPDDPLLHAPAQKLFDIFRPHLEKIGLLRHEKIFAIGIHREEHAIPIHNEEHAAHLRDVLEYISGIRRLRTIGRQGNFDHASLEHVVRVGFHAARSIIDEGSSFRRISGHPH